MNLKIKEEYQGKEIKFNGILIDQTKTEKFQYYYNNGLYDIFDVDKQPCPQCNGEGCDKCADLGYLVQNIMPVATKKKKGCTSCKTNK